MKKYRVWVEDWEIVINADNVERLADRGNTIIQFSIDGEIVAQVNNCIGWGLDSAINEP